MQRRVSLLLVLLALLAPLFPSGAAVQSGQNDCGFGGDAPDGNTGGFLLAPPVTCSGSIPHASDASDAFDFHAVAGTFVDFTSTPHFTCLYRHGSFVVCAEEDSAGRFRIAHVLKDGGRYTLSISGIAGMDTSYTFSLRLGYNDCGTGQEAGETFEAAVRIVAPVSCEGRFPASAHDRHDWYRIGVLEGQTLKAARQTTVGWDNANLCLYTPTGTFVTCGTHYGDGWTRIEHRATETGSYRLHAYTEGQNIFYWLTASVSGTLVRNDCRLFRDVADAGTGERIEAPNLCGGAVEGTADDPADHFRVYLPGASRGNLSLEVVAGQAEVCVADAEGVLGCRMPDKDGFVTLPYETTQAGDRAVQIRGVTTPAGWRLAVSTENHDDCGIGRDAGDFPWSPARIHIVLPKACAGHSPEGDPADVYEMGLTGGHAVIVDLQHGDNLSYEGCLISDWTDETWCTTGTRLEFPPVFYWQDYVLRLRVLNGSGPYQMNATYAVSNDCGSGRDAHDQSFDRLTLHSGFRCEGAFDGGDVVDLYSIPVLAGLDVTVAVEPLEDIMTRLCFEDGTGTTLLCSQETRERQEIRMAAPADGRLFARLTRIEGADRYRIEVDVARPPDCVGTDAGDSFESASLLAPPAPLGLRTCSGRIWVFGNDSADWYKVPVDGRTVAVHMPQDSVLLCAYSPSGEERGCTVHVTSISYFSVPTRVKQPYVLLTPDEPGEWRVRVTDVYPKGGKAPTYRMELRTLGAS